MTLFTRTPLSPAVQPRPDDRRPPPHPDERTRLRVVLVGPKYAGNVGSVARVCANFGVEDLVLVEAPELTREARIMAVHAYELIERAPRVDTLAAALGGCDLVVGLTALTAGKEQDHLRLGLSLPDAAARIHAMDGLTALVFGREDYGLYNHELAACDLVTQIPSSPDYPSMNLSHAVAVTLYECAGRDRYKPFAPRAASNEETERMLATLDHLLRQTKMRPHKRRPSVLAVRRLVGRGRVSVWDYHRIMGVLADTLKTMDAWPPLEERWSRPDEDDA